MKKTTIVLTVASLLLVGCSSASMKQEELPPSSYITKEIKENTINSEVFATGIEYTPEVFKENATDIALIEVKSLDRADMQFFEFIPSTYGKFIVNESIYGSLESGKEYEYVKPGGTVSESEYDVASDPQALEKRERLRKERKDQNEPIYYNIQMNGDIEIEPGKTYLAYLTYNENKDIYEIIGFGEGLKEIKGISRDALKVKNNKNGEFEALDDYKKRCIDPYFS